MATEIKKVYSEQNHINHINHKIFERLLMDSEGKHIGIIPHINADLDALTTSVALAEFMKLNGIPKVDVLLEGGLYNGTKSYLNFLIKNGLKTEIIYRYLSGASLTKYDGFIVVDTNDPTRVSPIFDINNAHVMCVIDHHNQITPSIKSDLRIFDDDARASAEILAYHILNSKYVLSNEDPPDSLSLISTLLAVGILSDTSFLRRARSQTLEVLLKLIKKSERTYEELCEMAHIDIDSSSAIYNLNSLSSLKIIRIQKYIIASSIAKGSEQPVVNSFIMNGANVGFVAKKYENGKTHVSIRSDPKFPIDLGKFVISINKTIDGGSANGHPNSAGITIPSEPEHALNVCVKALKRELLKIANE